MASDGSAETVISIRLSKPFGLAVELLGRISCELKTMVIINIKESYNLIINTLLPKGMT